MRLSAGQVAQIERVLVEEGDSVEAGAPLFILRLDHEVERGGHVSENLISELATELSELERQKTLIIDSAELRLESIRTQYKELLAEKSALEDQLTAQSKRVGIARDILVRYEALGLEDAASFLEIQQRRESLTSQEQQRAAYQGRIAQAGRQAEALKAEFEELPGMTRQRISELNGRMAGLRQRKLELEARGRVVISTPIDGEVSALSGEAGGTVMPETILASIVPAGSQLYAQVFVPSRAIGFVEAHQDVRLMYQAYPHQRFGSAEGEVLSVSRSILRPEELPSALGLEEPAYKARIAIERQHVEAFGEAFALRPGMVLTAEIIQERRTFMQWILEPLRASQERAA